MTLTEIYILASTILLILAGVTIWHPTVWKNALIKLLFIAPAFVGGFLFLHRFAPGFGI